MVISFRNKKKKNMKKEYMIPQMEVVKIQQQSHLLAGSAGAHNLTNTDGFVWTNGLDEDDN